MKSTMKHLLVSAALLCAAMLSQASGQQTGLPPGDPAGAAVANGAQGAPSSVMAPTPSNFGVSEQGAWDEYQPPDYADGLTSVGQCCEICGGGANCIDVWYIEQRVRAWHRSKPRGIGTTGVGSFTTDAEGNSQFVTSTVMGTRSTTFDASAGYGATLRRYWAPGQENRDIYLELVYNGLNDWREGRAFNATGQLFTNLGNGTTARYGNLFSPFVDPTAGPTSGFAGFDRADHHEIHYESRINNFEFNMLLVGRSRQDRIVLHPNGRWRRECQPGIYGSYLFGLRYFSMNEEFHFLATGTTDILDNNTGDVVDSIDTQGTYDVNTYNDMLGLQFGMNVMYRRCLWRWGAEAKVAPCVNFASQRSRVFSNGVAAGDPFSGEDINETRVAGSDDVALLGEVSLVGYYEVRPNITLRASWDMMWAVGVAMAPEQLLFQTDPAPRVNTNGTAFYQGVSLGVIWTH